MKENKAKGFIIRIVDANLNRSREGLRVCEDIARFYLNNRKTIKGLKDLRHKISKAIGLFPFEIKDLFRDRDIESDIGKRIKPEIADERTIRTIFFANIQRTKESLRVLEECSKLFDYKISEVFRKLRFKAYEIEKETVKKLFSLCSIR